MKDFKEVFCLTLLLLLAAACPVSGRRDTGSINRRGQERI